MPSIATSPILLGQSRVAIRTLAIEVVSGPGAGLRAEADSERMTVGTAAGNTVVLTDPTVSRFHLELARTDGGVEVTDLESTNGTFAGALRLSRAVVPPETQLTLGRTVLRVFDGAGTTVELHESDRVGDLLGASPSMRRLMAQVTRVAIVPVPVLLIGESVTGKELVARALHEHSPRKAGPLVVVDSGALAPGVVMSELFGHERGSFTGADRQHLGAFERADGGTLFLDEIGELPTELQPQLLGALERRQFRRVGGQADINVDVRVIAATNRDLRAEVNSGRFRLDLYHRLAVVEMRLPPLRERVEDIPLLVRHFLTECGHEGPTETVISPADLATLATYRWPGNIRELRNWVEATVAMGESPALSDDGASSARADAGDDAHLALAYKDARNVVLGRFEQKYLARLIAKAGGNVSEAARRAKMDRSYLIKLLQRHGLRGEG
ncbi:MAG: sigma 54-dependent Fis family transcriptional regulator [Polyangiaceae bacterium]|nr:sigma 54-dependent Fis family transcriptional regulator [Polyangiaceae bacterium]